MSFGFEQLDRLISQLKSAQISAAPDQILAAHDLLLKLQVERRLPREDAQFRALLAPLFCRSPEEQERFYRLFEGWVGDASREERWVRPKPEVPAVPETRRPRRVVLNWLVAAAVLILVAYTFYSRFKPVPLPPPSDVPALSNAERAAESGGGSSSFGASVNDAILARPPELIEARAYLPWGLTLTAAQMRWFVVPIPFIVLGSFVAWRVSRRRVVLSKAKSDEPPSPHRLPVHGSADDLFATHRLRAAIDRLRAPTRVPMRQIDNRRTVDASLRSAGLFTPVYRLRRQLPEYLVLIDRTHPGDHLAAFGRSLIERLRSEGLSLYVYYFHGDPRRCQEEGQSVATVSLDEIESHFGRARLLLITDARGFCSPFTGKLERWTSQLSRWTVRMLLTPTPARRWGRVEFSLALSGVAVAPLDRSGLHAIARWITAASTAGPEALATAPLLRGAGSAPPLRPIVEKHFERWREPAPPPGVSVDDLLAELRSYLGEQGYLVLSALAFYPQLTWSLTLYVDWRLAPAEEEDEAREDRLFDLARLPWLRYSQMPDYLRLRLIRELPDETSERIRGLYRSLFESAEKAPRNAIELVVDDAPSEDLWQRLRARFEAGRRKRGPYSDRVFAKVLLFGKPGKLDIEVPRYLERMLPAARWQRVAVTGLAGLLLATVAGAAFWLGVAPLQPRLEQKLFAGERERNANRDVVIAYTSAREAMAQALGASLHDWGYRVSYALVGYNPLSTNGRFAAPLRVAFTTPDAQRLVPWIVDRVQYLAYARSPSVPSSGSSWDLERLQIMRTATRIATPDTGETRSPQVDSLPRSPAVVVWMQSGAEEPVPSVFQDRIASGGLGPEMVTLIASTRTARPFGRNPITLGEFRRFVADSGHQVEGVKGSGSRAACSGAGADVSSPVVCVSWDDAQAYATWLSQQTGFTYRLPTADEWLGAQTLGPDPDYRSPASGEWTSQCMDRAGAVGAAPVDSSAETCEFFRVRGGWPGSSGEGVGGTQAAHPRGVGDSRIGFRVVRDGARIPVAPDDAQIQVDRGTPKS